MHNVKLMPLLILLLATQAYATLQAECTDSKDNCFVPDATTPMFLSSGMLVAGLRAALVSVDVESCATTTLYDPGYEGTIVIQAVTAVGQNVYVLTKAWCEGSQGPTTCQRYLLSRLNVPSKDVTQVESFFGALPGLRRKGDVLLVELPNRAVLVRESASGEPTLQELDVATARMGPVGADESRMIDEVVLQEYEDTNTVLVMVTEPDWTRPHYILRERDSGMLIADLTEETQAEEYIQFYGSDESCSRFVGLNSEDDGHRVLSSVVVIYDRASHGVWEIERTESDRPLSPTISPDGRSIAYRVSAEHASSGVGVRVVGLNE